MRSNEEQRTIEEQIMSVLRSLPFDTHTNMVWADRRCFHCGRPAVAGNQGRIGADRVMFWHCETHWNAFWASLTEAERFLVDGRSLFRPLVGWDIAQPGKDLTIRRTLDVR